MDKVKQQIYTKKYSRYQKNTRYLKLSNTMLNIIAMDVEWLGLW